MPDRSTIVFLVLVSAGLLLFSLPAESAAQQEIQRVQVTNFPKTQEIRGNVSVEGTIRHAAFRSLTEIVVSPVRPAETTRLKDGGVLETDGFTSLVLSLNGRPRGKILEAGTVGAILVPEEETVLQVFQEEGQFQFPMEVSAALAAGSLRSFASNPTRVTIAFPRYRVWLYNTSDRTVSVNLFVYATN